LTAGQHSTANRGAMRYEQYSVRIERHVLSEVAEYAQAVGAADCFTSLRCPWNCLTAH
jgi:hypothetical protein